MPADVRHRLERDGQVVRNAPGQVVFGGTTCPNRLFFLLEGTLRVVRPGGEVREITLFRVTGGESCILSTACLLAEEARTARGVAETDLLAVAVPRASFDALMADSSDFREIVLHAYGRRVAELITRLHDVTNRSIDSRLAEHLLTSAAGDSVRTTHAALAADLATARPVISRALAGFRQAGLVTQDRGCLIIRDQEGLARRAAQRS